MTGNGLACNRCQAKKPTVVFYKGVGLNLCRECAKHHNGLGNLTTSDSVQLTEVVRVTEGRQVSLQPSAWMFSPP